MKITKKWLDSLKCFLNKNNIQKEGSVLMVPKGTNISKKQTEYAKKLNIEIVIDKQKPTKSCNTEYSLDAKFILNKDWIN